MNLQPVEALVRFTASQKEGVDSSGASLDELARLLDDLGVLPDDFAVMIAILTEETDEDGGPAFNLRLGNYQIDLKSSAGKMLVNGAVLTGALAATHQSSIPATVLSVIVPFLFDLERVELSESDKYIYATLLTTSVTPDSITSWYESLPDAVSTELTLLEFRNVVDRLDDLGLADLDVSDGRMKVPQPTPRRLVRLKLPQL